MYGASLRVSAFSPTLELLLTPEQIRAQWSPMGAGWPSRFPQRICRHEVLPGRFPQDSVFLDKTADMACSVDAASDGRPVLAHLDAQQLPARVLCRSRRQPTRLHAQS